MFGTLPPEVALDDEDRQAAAATYSPLVEGVRRAVSAGVLAGDPDRIALHLWVVAHGMVSLELSGQSPLPADEAEQAYEEALGLAVQPFMRSA
jgi:hypothetical protein